MTENAPGSAAQETPATSHGNMVSEHGNCPVCGRQDVPLTRQERYGTRGSWLVCANEYACFEAWEASTDGT